MTRYLANLAAFNILILLAAFSAGWVSFFYTRTGAADSTLFLLHLFLGLTAVIATLAVHSLIFIYFLGTGRWVKEVARAYEIPDAPLPRLTRDLKRRTFPVALTAMLVTIATAAAGAGVQVQFWSWPWHAGMALVTLGVNGWAFVIEYRNVAINAGIIDQVMSEVERIRADHGLPTNAEAWRKEYEESIADPNRPG
jgi:hypothetical protein